MVLVAGTPGPEDLRPSVGAERIGFTPTPPNDYPKNASCPIARRPPSMTRYRNHLAAFLTLNVGLLFAVEAQAGSWQNSAPFGATLQGDLYTPTTPAASPAILVAIHMCTGHSSTVHGWFDSYADKAG